MSNYLKLSQQCVDSIDSKLTEVLDKNTSGRVLKKEIEDNMKDEIINDIAITRSEFGFAKCRLIEFQKDQSISSTQPQSKGAYYDTTIYNDGSNDYYPYLFGKTFDHNATTGFILKADGDKLIDGVFKNTQTALEAIPRHSSANRKLEGVPCSNSQNNEAKQPFTVTLRGQYEIETGKSLFEMMEVYCKQLVRDIPFINWDSDSTVSNLVTYLNNYGSDITAPTVTGNITVKTFLRGSGPGETVGPYISQFLIKPFMYGNMSVTHKFRPENNANTQLSMADWLNVQQGVTEYSAAYLTNDNKHVYSPRVLASIVHNDPFYQFYYNAALIANISSIVTSGYDNSSINSTVWTDGGDPALLVIMAEVGTIALHVAWYQKYGLTLKIRPEVLAQRITLAFNNAGLRSSVDKLNDIYTEALKGSNILSLVNTQNVSNGGEDLSGNNYYLNVLYPEGSPTHPAYPAGHACVAGAMVTVLKAMIKTHNSGTPIAWVADGRTAEQPSVDGESLVAYSDGDASSMTIVGELNKLASNIALGRDFAGVHYRADGDQGILSGEEIAIDYLQRKIKEFGATDAGLFNGFELEKMDGSRIMIKKDEIEIL